MVHKRLGVKGLRSRDGGCGAAPEAEMVDEMESSSGESSADA